MIYLHHLRHVLSLDVDAEKEGERDSRGKQNRDDGRKRGKKGGQKKWGKKDEDKIKIGKNRRFEKERKLNK